MNDKIDPTKKLDIGGVNESGRMYAPKTEDGDIHHKRSVCLPPEASMPKEPKVIDGKKVIDWVFVEDEKNEN